MKTLENLILGDWGPTMRGIARALGYAAMVPAAIALVFAQWLAFTWRRPLAGALVLVPVRNPGALYGSIESISSIPHFPQPTSETPPVAPQPPAREVSDEAVAGIRALVLGLAGSTEPPAPLPPVLAPGPRRQRRDSKQPQNPA